MAKNDNTLLWLGAAGLVLYFLFKPKSPAYASVLPGNSTFDLSQFSDEYGADNVQRLINLYADLLLVPDLSTQQIQLMLSQALVESGLFTSVANIHNVDDLNNFAGIKGNSHWPAEPGGMYALYPTINDFITDWLRILSMSPGHPIDATGVTDYVNRLVQNHYFESAPNDYIHAMQSYYDMLNNVAV